MKRTQLVLLVLGLVTVAGCFLSPDGTRIGDGNSDVETWEFLPFYGETRFLIVQDGTDIPIPDAALQVENLLLVRDSGLGQDDNNYLDGDQNGRITIHQLEGGITYMGDGPPPPTFSFTAPNHHPKTFTVEELVNGTTYDPYSSDDLPTTMYTYAEGEEAEIPVYEFTIKLTVVDAAQPVPTAVPPTLTPVPTLTPIPVPPPMGQILFAYNPSESDITNLYWINSDGNELQRLTDLPDQVKMPQLSPDGTQAIFSFADASAEAPGQLFILDIESKAVTQLTDSATDKQNPVWAPNGRSIAFIELRPNEPETITILDLAPMTETAVYSAVPSSEIIQLTFSPAGDKLAFVVSLPTESESEQRLQTFTVNTDGTQLLEIHTSLISGGSPNWSPDGNQLAFVEFPLDRSGGSDINSVFSDGTGLIPLVSDENSNYAPTWSPDGNQLAYVSFSRDLSTSTIVLIEPNGANPVQIGPDFQFLIHLSWLPDSRWLLVHANLPSEPFQFYLVDSVSKQWVQVTSLEGSLSAPNWIEPSSLSNGNE